MNDDDGWVEDLDQLNAAPQQQYNSYNSYYNQSHEFETSDRSYQRGRGRGGNQRFQRSYDNSSYNRSQNGYSRNQRQNYDDAEKVMVHHSIIGRIIGSGGSNIKDMQKQSGARIKILQDEGGGNAVPIAISGKPECVESARKLIQEILDETDKYYGKTRSVAKDESTNNQQDNGQPQTGFLANGNLDWDAILSEGKIFSEKKWGALPAIRKNFYVEDPDVADMSDREVAQWRVDNFDLTIKDLSGLNRPILNPVLTFEQAFSQYPEVLREIRKQGFVKPSPIQSQIWPVALRGYDAIGIAQTGTGKTLAFLLPIMIHIDLQSTPREERSGPSAVIITPTRELALQIVEEIKKYRYKDMRCVCIYGGGDRRQQVDQVRAGVEIIVATPGRLNDLLACEIIDMMSVTFLVLDEADRMLDLGFEPEINKILIDIRPDRQTIMTSATWPPNVRGMASNHLKEPFQVNVGSLDLAATHTVEQIIEIVEEVEKRERLLRFIEEMGDEDKVLVFVGRKSTCDNVSADLFHIDINCQSIHGGREQYDREQALDEFKTGATRILIATDVASRGLDVRDITHVFNYDLPRNTEEYVHRVGRTGRAGRTGVSISLVTRDDWGTAKELIAILEEAQQEIPAELYQMADRFAAMKERKSMQRRGGGGGRGGRGRSRGGYRRGGW